jgi:hypothetical protein
MYSQGCVLDITEWAECVGGELTALPPDAHDVVIELSEVLPRPRAALRFSGRAARLYGRCSYA